MINRSKPYKAPSLFIGHLKDDHRLGRNFYKGLTGDSINVMLAAAAFNFKRAMRALFCALSRIIAVFTAMFGALSDLSRYSLSGVTDGKFIMQAPQTEPIFSRIQNLPF